MKKLENASKKWNYKEIEYLKNSWGAVSIKSIAKTLNRSVKAVKLKAGRLKLGNWFDWSEFLTLNQFHQMLFNKPLADYTVGIWKRAGMPIKNIKKINKTYQMISLEAFIRWYKNHKTIIDLSLTEDGDFGIEPDWLKEKRKADKMARAYKSRPWTKLEDDSLKVLLSTYRYGYREISIRLKRTEGSIKRRMLDLGIKQRPLRADNTTLWTEQEIAIVKDKHLKGYKSVVIAEFVNRSALAINGLLERHNYFGAQPSKERVK